MPSIQSPNICSPITIYIPRPRVKEEELYVMHHVGGQGPNISCFETLRFGRNDRLEYRPGGRMGWHWESLPLAPFDGIISSHTVVDGGRIICVSSAPDDFGTYCFGIVDRDWQKAVDWVLLFEGGAEYDPELKIWLGFSSTWPHQLCATSDLSAMDKPPTVRVLPDLNTPENWSVISCNLLNLGRGRFCVAKQIGVVQDTRGEDYSQETFGPVFVVLTGVELLTKGGATEDNKPEGLQIVSHRSQRYIIKEDEIQWVL